MQFTGHVPQKKQTQEHYLGSQDALRSVSSCAVQLMQRKKLNDYA